MDVGDQKNQSQLRRASARIWLTILLGILPFGSVITAIRLRSLGLILTIFVLLIGSSLSADADSARYEYLLNIPETEQTVEQSYELLMFTLKYMLHGAADMFIPLGYGILLTAYARRSTKMDGHMAREALKTERRRNS